MLQTIDHINIVVSDLEKTKKFFINLGFEVISEDDLEGKWIDKVVGLANVKARFVALKLKDENTKIELIKYYNPKEIADKYSNKPYHIGFRHVAFRVKNIEKLYKKLRESGIKFWSSIQKYKTGKKLCYFSGPDNIILELSEYKKSN